MTTPVHPQAQEEGATRTEAPQFTATSEQAIDGRYRPISTHQLAMAWWLHQAGHITRRQLRIYFAAHEMAEQRRYTSSERRGHERYQLQQLKRLVGGRGSQTADRDLSADVRRLQNLGLVSITRTSIVFASSIEQIRLEDRLDGFWTFFQALPNRQRRVPVPRRTLRALAAGFSRGVTAYILATLIRSVFWHRQPGGGGEYRVDGRTKGSWVAEVFGISRRTVSDARAHLIGLGWLRPRETPQWALNKWGVHDVVNVHWSPANEPLDLADPVDNSAVGEGRGSGESATPSFENSAGSASPCLNRSSLPTGDSKTRKLGAEAPSPSGDCISSRRRKSDRNQEGRSGRSGGKPNIRDIRTENLKDPEALRELRAQAIKLGFAFAGESGELDFFALANRALTRGQKPGALFFDLISKHRTAFITISDEEAARLRLRELRNGPTLRRGDGGGERQAAPPERELTEEERIVEACIRVARQHRVEDPFTVARRVKRWTRPHWDDAYLRYRTAQIQRSQAQDECRVAARVLDEYLIV